MGSKSCLANCTCGRHIRSPETRQKLAQAKLGKKLSEAHKQKISQALAGGGPHYKDGRRGHYLYGTWWNMLSRCENPNTTFYHDYGGRGITVCDGWHDSMVFIRYMIENHGDRPEGYTLDRIDNGGNYEPGNVRWATKSEQARNRRKKKQ